MGKRAVFRELRSGDCRVPSLRGLSLEGAGRLSASAWKTSRYCRDVDPGADPALFVGSVIACLKRGGVAEISMAMDIIDAIESENADSSPD